MKFRGTTVFGMFAIILFWGFIIFEIMESIGSEICKVGSIFTINEAILIFMVFIGLGSAGCLTRDVIEDIKKDIKNYD